LVSRDLEQLALDDRSELDPRDARGRKLQRQESLAFAGKKALGNDGVAAACRRQFDDLEDLEPWLRLFFGLELS